MYKDDKKIKGKRRRRCDICSKLRYNTEKCINPYIQDIQGIEHKEVICLECYNTLVDGI